MRALESVGGSWVLHDAYAVFVERVNMLRGQYAAQQKVIEL